MTVLEFGSITLKSFSLQDFLYLLRATLVTLELNGVSLLGALLVGILVGILRFLPFSKTLRIAASIYMGVFRSVPVLLQMFVGFFGLALLNIELNPFFAVCVVLVCWASSFVAGVVCGTLQSIPTEQWEAALSLGMGYGHVLAYIIIPQAIRTMIPPIIGIVVDLVKASSLAYVVGFTELTMAGRRISAATFQPFVVYFFVGLIFFSICFPLSMLANVLERKLSKYAIKS